MLYSWPIGKKIACLMAGTFCFVEVDLYKKHVPAIEVDLY